MNPDGNVSFELSESPPRLKEGVLIVVREALLPMLLWEDIKVVRHVRKELTIVERFILEVALTLKTFYTGEIEEITSIPRRAVQRIVRHLVSMGALSIGDDGNYSVLETTARKALKEKALIEKRGGKLTFVYLPGTDDLLAFDKEKGDRRALELDRLMPASSRPVSADVQQEKKHAFLNRRVSSRSVANLPDDVVEVPVPDDDRNIPELCPAYHCHGQVVREDDSMRLFLTIYSKKRKDEDEPLSVPVNLTGADALVKLWTEMAELLEKEDYYMEIWRLIEPKGSKPISVERLESGEWSFSVDRDTAQAIASGGRYLVLPFGLLIKSEESILHLAMKLVPSDGAAATVFAVDEAVTQLLKVPEPLTGAHLDRVASELTADPEAIKGRMWGLRHYRHIYSLREREDFCYE